MSRMISLVLFGASSVESGPDEPAEVPRVPAEQLAMLQPGGPAALRVSGAAGRRRFPSPSAGFTPPRETRARKRGRNQEQEGPAQPHRLHRAAADGPGEALREAEVPVHPRQVSDPRTHPAPV